MSENIAPVSTPTRSVQKSSAASPLSSPSQSAPGSPHHRMSAPESDPESVSLADSPLAAEAAPVPATAHPPAPQESTNTNATNATASAPRPSGTRRLSFGLSFLSSFSSTLRGSVSLSAPPPPESSSHFMSNSPTIGNLSGFAHEPLPPRTVVAIGEELAESAAPDPPQEENTVYIPEPSAEHTVAEPVEGAADQEAESATDKDGLFSIRLTPIIDHSSSNTGLYFSPVIRRIKSKEQICVGRYTEKNKSAAHAPQGSSAPVVFKSKVVSRTHALFQCNEEGLWFIKDCKSSSGTFLNNIRLSQASQELTLWPLIDGDIVQLGLDYRGGTEEVYRCVKMRCEFNRSWQRKVNRFNLDIHNRMKSLGLHDNNGNGEELSECAICLFKLEPCQALFISPCSHSWHYKCIRPIIIRSYPQFYCPNCRSVCDLETDIEDEDE